MSFHSVKLSFFLAVRKSTVLVQMPGSSFPELVLEMVWVVAKHLSEHWMDWLLKNIGVEMSEEFVLSLMILVEVVLGVITSFFVQEFTTTVPQ